MKVNARIGALGGVWAFLAALALASDRFPIYWTGPHWIHPPGEAFFAAAGDVDGDVMGDLLLLSTDQPTQSSPQRALVRSGLNGSLLLTWTPSLPNLFGFQGSTVKPAGDLDLDGFGDVALSVMAPNVPPPTAVVEVRSGRDASVIAIIPPPAASNASLIGSGLAGAGDLDGDGWPELLVTGNHQVPVPGCMSWGQGVYNFEAPAFALQHYQTSWQCAQQFGRQIGRMDDVDGDGRPDFYIGAPRTYVAGMYGAGWIALFSGATGALISSVSGSAPSQELGGSVAALRDVTGDGKPELVVVEHGYQGPPGRVRILSLPSFSSVYALTTAGTGSFGFQTVDAMGDGDGDGFDDYLVQRQTSQGYATVTAYSGPTGAVIGEVVQVGGGQLYPWGALGDVNGDGLGDFVVTPGGPYLPGPGAVQTLWGGWYWPMTGWGRPTVHVARNFDLAGTPAIGGATRFQVVAPRRAGRPFQIAFSRDAVFPGVPLGPFLFPLAPDELFLATAALGIGGSLSGSGHGTASIPIPPDPTLQGVTLHASGVVYDPGGPLGIGCVLTRVTFAIQ